MENLPNEQNVKHSVLDSQNIKKIVFYVLPLIVFLVFFYRFFLSAPNNFPVDTMMKVENGSSLRSVSYLLEKNNIIRSRVAFEFFVIMFGGEKHIISANYLFENKLPVWEVSRRISGGEHRTVPVVITIKEGFDINQIADLSVLKLINFNKTKFLSQAKDKEGYLFPDTYFFLNNANEEDVIKSMSENFNKKINPLVPEIISSGKTEEEIIIMASIIEREANGDTDRGIISGILWKRIRIGMPLQVDAAPNTYKVKGLPENPISNPGLLAIKAAIYGESSPYLYYLHDKSGNTYYAKNFTEHRKNINKYLK